MGKKFNFKHMSLKLKTIIIILPIIMISVLSVSIFSINAYNKGLTQAISSEMASIANSYSSLIEYRMKTEDLGYQEYFDMLSDVHVNGMDSSYVYLVDKDGIMKYHPTEEKIGNSVENEVVKGIVSDLSAGKKVEDATVDYLFKGVVKYASYHILSNNSILIVTADESEALASIKKLTILLVILSVVIIFASSFGIYNFIRLVAKRINVIKVFLKEITNGNLNVENLEITREDEIGEICIASVDLKEKLRNIVSEIKSSSNTLNLSVDNINKTTSSTTENVKNISLTITEIAQGAMSQAENTQTASEEAISIGNEINKTHIVVNDLNENTEEMIKSNKSVISNFEELDKANEISNTKIREISMNTDATNESVKSITAAISVISDIANQTNLLSLNASIEATHAGDKGKGFAVVADEIRKLAEQSKASAEEINRITKDLLKNSKNSVVAISEVDSAMNTQNKLLEVVKDSIRNSNELLKLVSEKVGTVKENTDNLDESKKKITSILEDLSAISEENAASTEETSASTEEILILMEKVEDMTKELTAISKNLESNIEIFKL